MTKEDHEKELHRLYDIALKNDNVEICLDILGQLQHFGFSLPPMVVPEHFKE